MTYFHTGTRTIIGAEAFHCPVRDGKEWDHLAMVIRLDLLPGLVLQGQPGPIHRVRISYLIASIALGVRIVPEAQNDFDDCIIKIIGSSRTSN